MVDPISPAFREPGSYVRYYGSSITNPQDAAKKFRYVRLLEREDPLRYPYTFPLISVDTKGGQVTFNDLDVAQGHIYQAFLGVALGTRVQVFAPFDTRLLNFDTSASAISPDETAIVTHGLSPWEAPTFDIWIPPNKQYPALLPINKSQELVMGGKSILPQVMFIVANFRTESIEQNTQPELFDMLEKKKIYSLPIRMGSTIRSIPR